MRIMFFIGISILLCGCDPSSTPVAQAPLDSVAVAPATAETCKTAFATIARKNGLAESAPAYQAAAFACEYARAEVQALSLCERPFTTASLVRDPSIAAGYGLRKRTLAALMDAELYGEKLGAAVEARRLAQGGPPKSEAGCHILVDDFPGILAQREDALRALGQTGRY